ncbi:MAG: phosphatidate cytidylyltransferase [bacterium]
MPTLPALHIRPKAKQRILSGIAMVSIVAATYHFGQPYINILLLLLAILGVYEWSKVCGLPTPHRVALYIVVGALMSVPLLFTQLISLFTGVIVVAVCLVLGLPLLFFALKSVRFRGSPIVWALLGMMFCAMPPLALHVIYSVQPQAIVSLIVLVALVDTLAYIVGKNWGKYPMTPILSPKKTWEGFAAGVLLAPLLAISFDVFIAERLLLALPQSFSLPSTPLHWGYAGGCYAILAVFAQLSDLLESAVKRHFKVKDMSNIIPGHGGVLDRLDSLILTAPLVALMTVVSYLSFLFMG